jgi:hypothetical protein
MPHAYTEDQLVEQPRMNKAMMETRGWISFTLSVSAELDLCQQMLGLAARLGTPVALRSDGSLCDMLMPTVAHAAKPRSLSKIHSVGEFPLHIDTAHWLTPCRYIMLACVSPGSGSRPTLVLDTRQLPLNEHQMSFGRTPFFGPEGELVSGVLLMV